MAAPKKPGDPGDPLNETKDLKPDRLVERLLPDPGDVPPDVIELTGWLGRGATEGHWRLYLSAQLDRFAEIAEADIVHHESMASEENPLGGTRLWVKRSAQVHYRKVESRQIQAEYLMGEITRRFFASSSEPAIAAYGPDVFLQDNPPSGARTCPGAGHLLTRMDGSCKTQRECTEQPECPPREELPIPKPKNPQHTNPYIVCTRHMPGSGKYTSNEPPECRP